MLVDTLAPISSETLENLSLEQLTSLKNELEQKLRLTNDSLSRKTTGRVSPSIAPVREGALPGLAPLPASGLGSLAPLPASGLGSLAPLPVSGLGLPPLPSFSSLGLGTIRPIANMPGVVAPTFGPITGPSSNIFPTNIPTLGGRPSGGIPALGGFGPAPSGGFGPAPSGGAPYSGMSVLPGGVGTTGLSSQALGNIASDNIDPGQLAMLPGLDIQKLKDSRGRKGYALGDLKDFVRRVALRVSGSKSELVDRILGYLRNQVV